MKMVGERMDGTKAVVTGGAGFIGSELVRQLAAAGAAVTVIDNLVTGRRSHLDGLPTEQVRLVISDIRDTRIAEHLEGADVVYHLACLGVRHSIHSPQENHEVNATGTLQVVSAAARMGVRRFVCVSSSEVYGSAQRTPMAEDHPTYPTTVYGASKLAGESYARAFFATYGYPTVVVRPFNTYGPRCHHEGDSGEVIPRMILRCMAGQPVVIFGTGAQSRDFTHVTDTARGILLAGIADRVIGETINLGGEEEISINELALEVSAVVGKPRPEVIYDDPRPGDIQRLSPDITKARRLLGYEPRISLREGLASVRDWYHSLGKPPEVLLEEETVRNWEVARALPRRDGGTIRPVAD